MIKLKAPQVPGGQKILSVETIPTVNEKFNILRYVVRVVVSRIPFMVEVNVGGYRSGAWNSNSVWAIVEPDKNNATVKRLIHRAATQAKSRGFPQSILNQFAATCEKCRHKNTSAQFRKILVLPPSADVDVSASVSIALREGKYRRVHEELIMIPQEIYELCLIHGPYVRHNEEPFD